MLIKGSCQKQNLMEVIHDAILSKGSNWTEISSNKTNDFKHNGTMSDGWVFKSPVIGEKKQNIFLTLKSLDLSVVPSTTNGGNNLFIWLADNYVPNDAQDQNGTYTNKSPFNAWTFCQIDTMYCSPTSMFDYFIDIQDYRILMVIERTNSTTMTYPQFLYIGYPDITTNLEGSNYTNQLILGSNLCKNNSTEGVGYVYWHRCTNGTYFSRARTICNLNASNPTPMGLYLVTPIQINADGLGGNVENTGVLGVLSGIYCLPNTNIINGDIVNLGSDSYKVFNTSQWIINTNTWGGTDTPLYYYNSIVPIIIAIKIN